MFWVVLLHQSVDRFHLNLVGSLTTDFAIKTKRFKITCLFCFSVTLTGACPESVSFI